MVEPAICDDCGEIIPKDAPSGQCPNCLVGLGLGNDQHEGDDLSGQEQLPRQFGDYELMSELGRGGMGVVYKAREISLNRLTALKMIRPRAVLSRSALQRFVLEAEAAASLRHPNIVCIYRVGEHEGQHFFSMELIEGVDLEKYLRAGRFNTISGKGADRKHDCTQRTIAQLMVKVALAVDYAHRHGVLHRDLKPGNILIDDHDEPHIVDFGLAKMIEQTDQKVTDTGAIMGTPAYMAPEQASGQKERISTATDIFSLGAILYTLLTGRAPFRGETLYDTIRQVIEEEPRHPTILNDAVDPDLAIVCLKCLEKDPARRYPSANALAEDLNRWLRGEAIEARSVNRVERLWRWCRREPTLASLTAGVTFSIVAAALLALFGYSRERRHVATLQETRDMLVDSLNKRLDVEWEDPIFPFVKISADERDLIVKGQLPVRALDKPPERVALGVHFPSFEYNPQRLAEYFLPLLHYLETNITGVRLRFDLLIYKDPTNAARAVVSGEIQAMRVSAPGYVLARRQYPALSLLAKQENRGQGDTVGAIFCRADSALESLSDLKQRSVGLIEAFSPVGNIVPKAELYDRGILSTDLLVITNLRSRELLAAIKDGRFHAGVLELEHVLEANEVNTRFYGKPLFRILHQFRAPNYTWVGGPKLSPHAAQAIKQSLLRLQEPDILGPLAAGGLTGFTEASPSDYEPLEAQMEKARLFESSH